MKRNMFLVGLTMLSVSAFGQSKFMQPNFSSSGGTVSTNSTQRVYSVIGQPIAVSNTTRSQTQAGFMQVVNYVIEDAPASRKLSGAQIIAPYAHYLANARETKPAVDRKSPLMGVCLKYFPYTYV